MKFNGWTADFKEFKQKVESVFGPLDKLAKESPNLYTHQVLSHGFMEYIGVTGIGEKIRKENKDSEQYDACLKQEYLKWVKDNKLPEDLLELGWIEYIND